MTAALPLDTTIAESRIAWLSGDREAWKVYSEALRRRSAESEARDADGPARPVRRRRYRSAGRFSQSALA